MQLTDIACNVQNIAEAIASVIKVEVTIVDHNLFRIAGTDKYKNAIGERISKSSAFGFVRKKGESLIIENPRHHKVCLGCDKIHDCKEYAEVCCPIIIGTKIIGVIGLIAFEKEQKQWIMKNEWNLMDFLGRMSDLIASKLLEEEKTKEIKILVKELEIVLNTVDRGIIATDEKGYIIHYNQKASELFHMDKRNDKKLSIQVLLSHMNLNINLMQNIQIKNREFRYKIGRYEFRGVLDARPMRIGNRNFGILFTFSNISEVLNVVNDLTTTSIITSFDHIIGKSLCLDQVKDKAYKASQSSSTVLIQGESGTGKELFARAIHFQSHRKNQPFIPINCAAIPEQLLESELFGYEEGAFTGCKKGGKAGKFELAYGGTIFLDEMGDMPIHLQSKLLRVLQEYTIEKVGGKNSIPIDVRIIAATNQNLEKKVREGAFREDLFYRLNVIPINIPPLRKRKEDMNILVGTLLDKCNHKLNKNIEKVEDEVIYTFMEYDWPGNVRELENTIEYAVNMCSAKSIHSKDLPAHFKEENHKHEGFLENESILSIQELEKREIQKAIKYFGNDKQAITKASKALGISRATLYRKIKFYKIVSK